MTNLPAFLQNYKRGGNSSSLDSLTKMSTGSQPYISIQGNRFRAIDAVGDEQMIGDIDRKTGIAYADFVIIDANDHVSKVYYAGEFDPKAAEYTPPDCWSDNGIAPSTQAAHPQCRSCAECPLAVWGSDTSKLTGKQTKACNDVKKIAVYVQGFEGAFLMRVPPASLKELANYARTLAANGATVAQVITRAEFKADGIGMMTFRALNWISEKDMDAINDLDQSKVDLLVNRNDQPRTGELPSPAQIKKITGGGSGGNGTPAPKEPPKEMFERETAPVEKPAESEAEALRRQLAEMQAKLAAAESDADKPKRTRRTKEQIEADKAAEAAKADGGQTAAAMFSPGAANAAGQEEEMEVPAFLNGGQAGAKTTVVNRSGGQPADAPSPDLKKALDAAFSLNVGN